MTQGELYAGNDLLAVTKSFLRRGQLCVRFTKQPEPDCRSELEDTKTNIFNFISTSSSCSFYQFCLVAMQQHQSC